MSDHDPGDLLERGTREHYDDAAYYDHAYKRRRDDVDFYRGTARRLGGPVLELGVGTGRVALELARDGHTVVGVAGRKGAGTWAAVAVAVGVDRSGVTATVLVAIDPGCGALVGVPSPGRSAERQLASTRSKARPHR